MKGANLLGFDGMRNGFNDSIGEARGGEETHSCDLMQRVFEFTLRDSSLVPFPRPDNGFPGGMHSTFFWSTTVLGCLLQLPVVK